MKHIKVFLP